MSRAALNRQEANVKERQRQAEEAFRLAVDEGRSRHRSAGVLPLVGPDDTFNINSMLLHNISVSPYFYQECYGKIKDWNALVDEIYYEVKHLEPWTPGAFALFVSVATCQFCASNLRVPNSNAPTHLSNLVCISLPLPFLAGKGASMVTNHRLDAMITDRPMACIC